MGWGSNLILVSHSFSRLELGDFQTFIVIFLVAIEDLREFTEVDHSHDRARYDKFPNTGSVSLFDDVHRSMHKGLFTKY